MTTVEERLEVVVEDCRGRLARGESVEQCLAAHPAQAEELRSLLPLLAPLRALAPALDAAYAHAARRRFHSRLLEERAKRAAAQGPTPLRWLRRVAIPMAAVTALAGSGFGLVTASADALPGSPLFPIQQAHEQVVQRLARTPEQQAEYQVNLTAHRLQQVRRAEALHASPAVIDGLTTSMLQATSRVAQDLRTVPNPQRQRILKQVAPLLIEEERVLAQERGQQTGLSPTITEQRRQQFLAAQKRLRAEATVSPTPPHGAPAQ